MYSYIPIIDLDLIQKDKITINHKNNKSEVLYDYGDGYGNAELNIKISTKLHLGFNKDTIQLHSQLLYELREYIDELYKKQIDNKDLRSRPQQKVNNKVTVNFMNNYSVSTLIPSNKSQYETVKTKLKDEFFNFLGLYYPYINSNSPNFNIVGDFVLKIFISKNNMFCSFAIFDSEISYDYNKKRTKIYKNTITNKKIIDSIEI
jgi:hypothetical protein